MQTTKDKETNMAPKLSSINLDSIGFDSIKPCKKAANGSLFRLTPTVCFQTPVTTLAWAVKRDAETGNASLGLNMKMSDPKIKDFADNIEKLRARVITVMQENRDKLGAFSTLTPDQIAQKVNPMIKTPPADKDFDPTFVSKIIQYSNKDSNDNDIITVGTQLYSVDKEEIDMQLSDDPTTSLLKRGDKVVAIVELAYIHLGKSLGFSPSFQVTSIMKLADAKRKFEFDVDDEDIVAAIKEQKVDSTPAAKGGAEEAFDDDA